MKIDTVEVREAVLRELDGVRVFAQVDHPNLVSIEDMGEVDGIPYIVMAFAGEQTLRQLVDSGELTRERALHLFGQVCRGVQALHDHSLVHFDLKPANVYLKGDIARVGDYGLSKLVTDSRNSLSMGRGTPYYMAPELLRRKGDARSDIYALGVMLYELLCGEPPFRGDSEWEVLRKHEEQEPVIPASVGEPERSVIARALAKDPASRFQSVRDLVSALVGRTAAAPPPPLPPPHRPVPPRVHQRRRGKPGRLLVALFAPLVLLFFLLPVSQISERTRVTRNTAPRISDRIPVGVPAIEMPSAPHRLLQLGSDLPQRIQSRLVSLSERLPLEVQEDRYYASLVAHNAGPFLDQLLAALEELAASSPEGAHWYELIRHEAASVVPTVEEESAQAERSR